MRFPLSRHDRAQRSLDFTPGSHRVDPWTSHAAERAVTESGARETNVRTIVALVREFPGLTALEYHALLPVWEQQEPRRRLTDAKNAGLVVQGAPKRRHAQAKREVTWWPK